MRKPKIPTLRGMLLGTHRTLIRIEYEVTYVGYMQPVNSTPLNEVERMVVLLEDKRFFSHFGVDFRSILREVWKLLHLRRIGGASTIEMQLVRTISQRYERTLWRKLAEAAQAVMLQRRFSKLEILRAYMNIAYMGTGLKGFSEAAEACFPSSIPPNEDYFLGQVDLSSLSRMQAAELASMLVYPKPRLVSANWRAKITRRANYGMHLSTIEKNRF